METSKIWRVEVFNHITHHLQLSMKSRQAMYKANVSVDSTHIQDIAQNLDYLVSNLKFTKEQISACPLILAHPHKDLFRVSQEVKSLLEKHFAWSASGHRQLTQTADLSNGNISLPTFSSKSVQVPSSTPSSTSFLSSLSCMSSPSTSVASDENLPSWHVQDSKSRQFDFSNSVDRNGMCQALDYSGLLNDPVKHLNILQYFLEKETGFSLLSTVSIAFSN